MAAVTRVGLLNGARYFKRLFSHTRAVNMSYFTDTRHVLPDGVFPTMITPMTEDKSVDWAGVDCKLTQESVLLIMTFAISVCSLSKSIMWL